MPSQLVIPPQSPVKFYSRFESGNLLKAVKIPVKPELSFSGVPINALGISHEFDLYLQADSNTDGHMHWFYFQILVKNLKKGTKIRLNIRNLVRGKSLFQEGMLPRLKIENFDDLSEWVVNPLITEDIKFYQTEQNLTFDREFYNRERVYHTLSFIYVV